MEFSKKSYPVEGEILANDHFVAKAVTLDFSSVSATENGVKVVKAGTPLKKGTVGFTDMVVGNGADAVEGFLWKNCYENRPVGDLIIHGFIDKAKGEAASGLTYATTTWTSKPDMVALV